MNESWKSPHLRFVCEYLTLELRHLQSVLYFWSVWKLGVQGDGGLSLPVFFVLFLQQKQIRSAPLVYFS